MRRRAFGRSAPSNLLSAILPTREQTWLLRASLQPGEAGRAAWQTWRHWAGPPREALTRDGGTKRLFPLLLAALRRNGEMDPTWLTSLRTARVREELRSEAFFGICRTVVSALATEGIPAILLKGAALAGAVYADPVFRHCHDIDLLVSGEDLARGARALRTIGFLPSAESVDRVMDDARLEHASGLRVELHSRPFRLPFCNGDLSDLWARSQPRRIAGLATAVLSPTDSLLHVCGHAVSSSNRASLLWACDAWHIVDRYPDLDWDLLVENAERWHLALPLQATLAYLREGLDASIPTAVLERLLDAAERDTFGREVALSGALAGLGWSYRSLIRQARGWRARALVLRWLLLPSPCFLGCVGDLPSLPFLPLYYLYRPLRYGARQLLARLRRDG